MHKGVDPYTFNNSLVRELAWIIGSSPLMLVPASGKSIWPDSQWYHELASEAMEWLMECDRQPALLEATITERPLRLLGKRFEKFLEFLFDNFHRFELLKSNIPIIGGGQTVGEIDFVVRDLKHDQVYHIEAACKFYLSSKNSSRWSDWKGPNPHDRLDLKMEKLETQLSWLQERAIAEELQLGALDIVPLAWMKGAFHHHFSHITTAKPPLLASLNYPAGWWMKLRETDALSESAFWLVLEKDMWMSPQCVDSDHPGIMDTHQVQQYLQEALKKTKPFALLVQLIEEAGMMKELSRGFVVRNSWPD